MARPTRKFILSAADRAALSNDVGLSPVTLGRFLAGSLDLPDASATRVEASILDLGLGRVVEHARPVVLMVPDLAASYFSHMAQSIEQEAVDVGWDLLVALTSNSVEREIRLLSSFPPLQVAGILLFTNNGSDRVLLDVLASRDDVVALAEVVAEGKSHRVVNDYLAVGRLAARHLTSLGHKRVAFVGGPPQVDSTKQITTAFFRDKYPSMPSRALFQTYLGMHSEQHGYDATLRLAARPDRPTAIFAGSSVIAQGVIRACSQLGWTIPDDISLIAFDGTGPLDLLRPSVTSISVSMEDIARRGLTLLQRHAHRHGRAMTDKVGVTLHIRESTAPPRRS